MLQIYDANEARSRWREVVDAAALGRRDVVVQRHGKRVAVVISYEDYVAVQECLEDLRLAREAAAELEAWRRDSSLGKTLEQIESELDAGETSDG